MVWTELRVIRSFVARNPLVIAFSLSLSIHLALFGGWKMGKRLGWWEHQATWLLDWKKKQRPRALRPAVDLAKAAAAQREIPLTFVEVDPSTATPDAPKDAKYYGAHSSRAANPDPTMESVVPKADGQQDKLVRLENVPKPGPQPLQPAAPPPEKAPEPVEPKPKGGETPGDLAKLKPEEIKNPNDGQTEIGAGQTPAIQRERPRTLAAARQQKMLAGDKMKQDGGTMQRGNLRLDVAETPFGSYDAALVAAVQQRWYDLLDTTRFAQRSGKVVLEFKLHFNGRITDLKVDGNEVGEMLGLLCQRAILDPAPFAPWPSDMRRAVEKTYRDVMFTFYYN